MKMNTTYRFFTFIIIAVLAVAFAGCKKDKKTIATITVVNNAGAPVPGATVVVYSACSECPGPAGGPRFDPSKNSALTQVTNGAGKVSYDFTEYYKKGQAGFAVLDVKVTKGSLTGTGIIKIEEETTSEETITIE